MKLTITYYLDVISSWCYWAEPAWAELKQRYADQPVEFAWKISLIDPSGLPVSRQQEDWFYRRSGSIVGSPFRLNSGWFEPGLKEYLAPNCVAEAAKDFGISDDRIRLTLTEAAVCEGKKVGRWEVSAEIAAQAAGLSAKTLLAKAKSPKIRKQVQASTKEFHALQATQRPAFLLENNIGDRAMFSGLVKTTPLAVTIDAMLADAKAYAVHAAHFGQPPAH
jgi:predicted DsbA family dithiol-disulfide isomerase